LGALVTTVTFQPLRARYWAVSVIRFANAVVSGSYEKLRRVTFMKESAVARENLSDDVRIVGCDIWVVLV
jgi:hypothetical protein